MKFLNSIFSVLLGFALIGSLMAGAYFVLRFVINVFGDLDAYVASVIYAAIIAMLFSAVMISLIVRLGQKRTSTERMQMEKATVYQRFLAAWYNVLNQADTASAQSKLRMVNDLQAAEQQCLLWGSSNVIRHYTTYQAHGTSHDLRDPAIQPLIAKVLQEMRKDLGHSNVGIQTGDLFNLFVDTARHDEHNVSTADQGTRSAHRLFNGVSYQGAE